MGWELKDVEKPFVEQLEGLGWTHISGSIDEPDASGRANFTEVIQEGVLRKKLAEATGSGIDIRTLRGLGYVLQAQTGLTV